MKSFILFLNGAYPSKSIPFYVKQAKGKTTVAVDGGFRFFRQAKIEPDVIIGDFDSIKLPKNLPDRVRILRFPRRKDKTDSHLAIEFCLKERAESVDIVMPEFGDADHYLGVVFLFMLPRVILAAKKGIIFRILTTSEEMRLVVNGPLNFNNHRGKLVSLAPMSARVKFSCFGMEYNVREKTIHRGDSLALRNRIKATRAGYRVKGAALVIVDRKL